MSTRSRVMQTSLKGSRSEKIRSKATESKHSIPERDATKASKSKTKKPSSGVKLSVPHPPLDTPALKDKKLCYSYEIARGEMGVLTFEPYKSLVLPYWAFRTVPIATNSAEVLWAIFESYVGREDFVGADMTRKFIQMGMTRAKRYANHKGGRKYDEEGNVLKKWAEKEKDEETDEKNAEDRKKREEKEEASRIFKGYWRRCTSDEQYLELKETWKAEKASFEKKNTR